MALAWYSHPIGRLLCVSERHSTEYRELLAYKSIVTIMSTRNAGRTFTNDVITKCFSINNMPIGTSSYCNMVLGSNPSEVLAD